MKKGGDRLLYLGLAAGLALLAIGSAKVGYKIFSIVLGGAALVSFIVFLRNPSFPTPDLPDSIPLPGKE